MKPHILFLLHIPPPVHGSSVIGLSIKESICINNAFDSTFINLLASRQVNETGEISFQKLSGFFVTGLTVARSILKKKPALCYFALSTSGAAFYKDLLLILLLRLFGTKRIFHLHNKGVKQNQSGFFYNLMYRIAFAGSHVILLSQRLYSDVSPYVPKNRIHICPNGISQKERLPKKNETALPNILFLSNLIESKGVLILLQALLLLKDKGLEFRCTIVGGEGDISSKRLLQEIESHQLSAEVCYKGSKFGEEKEKIYDDADIFAFPSHYPFETFGLVNLEAMQHGLPVISTFEGGIPDVIEDGVTGFLIPQKSVVQLADKLEILILNKTLRLKMGEAGYQKYLHEFTLEIFENRLKDILNSEI